MTVFKENDCLNTNVRVCLRLCVGQCWCVDEDGEYIPDSLTSRSDHLPKCELTPVLMSLSDLLFPSCIQ